tara:strand:+ start:341 stop:763 length:423 start_codon:yes stop_codon:yes gene_type:complete
MNKVKSNRSMNRRRSGKERYQGLSDEQKEKLKQVLKKESYKNRNNKSKGRKEKFTNSNLNEMFKRLTKYLTEGLAVGIVGMILVMNGKQGSVSEQVNYVVIMAVTAAAVFAVLDMWAPSISGSARQGAGFGLGARMVGFP